MTEASALRWAARAAPRASIMRATPADYFGEWWVLVDVEGHGLYWCNRVRHVRWLIRTFGRLRGRA